MVPADSVGSKSSNHHERIPMYLFISDSESHSSDSSRTWKDVLPTHFVETPFETPFSGVSSGDLRTKVSLQSTIHSHADYS